MGIGKRAIIVGCNGQDGRILFDHLLANDYSVVGIARNGVRTHAAQSPAQVDILDAVQVASLVREFQPTEIYYLAAFHHSSEDTIRLDSRQLFEASHKIHVSGLINFLQALVDHCPPGKLFYAASSLIFGDPPTDRQDEQTPLNPTCVYGITKTAGIQTCRFYRHKHSIHASVGILYNHESPYRRPAFVSQKIVRGAIRIKAGLQDKLVLGNLSATVDWGWAADYVNGMHRIVNLVQADDFIVATGQPHTVGDFVEAAFGQLGLDWGRYVEENASLLPRDRPSLIGDSSKLHQLTGWCPTVGFAEMIDKLLSAAAAQLYLEGT
jgi:GDPmannose 4,6-dehydratase